MIDLYDHTEELMHNNSNLNILFELVEDAILDLQNTNIRATTVNGFVSSVNCCIGKFYIILKAMRNESNELRKNLDILMGDCIAKMHKKAQKAKKPYYSDSTEKRGTAAEENKNI